MVVDGNCYTKYVYLLAVKLSKDHGIKAGRAELSSQSKFTFYVFVAVFFEYMRMRNFSVFSICSHSIILLDNNTFYIPLGAFEWQ